MVVARILPALGSLSVGRRAAILLLVIAFARHVNPGTHHPWPFPRKGQPQTSCQGGKGTFFEFSPTRLMATDGFSSTTPLAHVSIQTVESHPGMWEFAGKIDSFDFGSLGDLADQGRC